MGVKDEGDNINGPSLIRIPDWIAPQDRADIAARYYLYFGDHAGDYIRMAWAENITGPWHLHQIGSNVSTGNRGVLDNGNRDIDVGNGIVIEENHLASPDVHVDNANQRIIMYFHSGSSTFYGGNGGSIAQNVVLEQCQDANENQHWRKVSVGGGSFRLEKRNSPGFSIDGGNGGDNRQNVYMWASDNGNQNQHWTFEYLD